MWVMWRIFEIFGNIRAKALVHVDAGREQYFVEKDKERKTFA